MCFSSFKIKNKFKHAKRKKSMKPKIEPWGTFSSSKAGTRLANLGQTLSSKNWWSTSRLLVSGSSAWEGNNEVTSQLQFRQKDAAQRWNRPPRATLHRCSFLPNLPSGNKLRNSRLRRESRGLGHQDSEPHTHTWENNKNTFPLCILRYD